jgi:hypothetical protein
MTNINTQETGLFGLHAVTILTWAWHVPHHGPLQVDAAL